MKINHASSAKIVSTDNMEAKKTERKGVSRGNSTTVDTFENPKGPGNEGLPQRNETIGGGYQRKEIPKGSNPQSDITKKTEDQPETPAWLKGKEHDRGIGWSNNIRPVDHSVTETGKVNNPLDNKGKKVGLDYFDKQSSLKEKIVADENSLNNFNAEQPSGDGANLPSRKNILDGNQGVPKGYGKNKSSKQEQASMFGNTQLISGTSGSESSNKGTSPIPYPKTESTNTNTTTKLAVETKIPDAKDAQSSKGDEPGVSRGIVNHNVMGKQFINLSWEENGPVKSKAGNSSTPLPDSVDDSHVPEAIRGGAPPRTDRPTKGDQVTLYDENKRQQENVYVEKQELFGSMVGRKTDGRSTPTPSDGTTDPNGPPADNGTGAVDINILHPKGDPPDGDEA